jgi:hypothetical protein
MSHFLGFGNGSDGVVTLSGTDAPIDSSCSGNSGSTSLSATNTSFAAGQMILIHQSRGTGVGQWEINKISSYVAGTITTEIPLAYTYTDSGSSQAQVLVLKQYSGVTISSTFTAKSWDGNVGGIVAFLCSGNVTITSTVTASNKGYMGIGGGSSQQQTGRQGEGSASANYSRTTAQNGNGGGGGQGGSGDYSLPAGAGGGGGHSGAGTTGTGYNGGSGGQGGSQVGDVTMDTIFFGGAGGEGGTRNNTDTISAVEGYGGGIVMIIARNINNTGSIVSNGQAASIGNSPYGEGGGAGGSIFLKGENIIEGTLTATGGAGAGGGGAGSDGRIRVEACNRTAGTCNPSASENLGGYDFCAVTHAIL